MPNSNLGNEIQKAAEECNNVWIDAINYYMPACFCCCVWKGNRISQITIFYGM